MLCQAFFALDTHDEKDNHRLHHTGSVVARVSKDRACHRTKIQTAEMRCFRRLLGISYRDHDTNKKVGNRIRQALGPYEDLLTTVKKRKLRWYGHKTRSTGLAKIILQGTVQGGRRRGRQKKRWEDVTEWTGLKLSEALRKVENREEWRTVVARSSLVPQRSTRLWDK